MSVFVFVHWHHSFNSTVFPVCIYCIHLSRHRTTKARDSFPQQTDLVDELNGRLNSHSYSYQAQIEFAFRVETKRKSSKHPIHLSHHIMLTMKSPRCCCRHHGCYLTLLCVLAAVSSVHGLALPTKWLAKVRPIRLRGLSLDGNSYLENLDALSGKKFRRKQVVQNIIDGSDDVVAMVASQELR